MPGRVTHFDIEQVQHFLLKIEGQLRRLRDDDRGASLLVVAIALPVILGAAGLAVDAYQWTVTKRELQQSADSAAIAGVYAAVQGTDVDAAVSDAAAESAGEDSAAVVSATLSPDGHDGDPYAVGVHIEKPGALFFTSLFLAKPVVIKADATATLTEAADFCVYGLGSSDATGIELKPMASLEAECRLATNAEGSQAVLADASATLKAARLLSYGGIAGNASGASARAHALRQKDPMREKAMPEIPNTGCPNMTYNADVSGTTIKPGCFGNLTINGQVTLEPGNYILNRGNLELGPSASISCDGCSIFLTTDDPADDNRSVGSVRIPQGAIVDLTAPRDGDYAGVLIYQDRRASKDDSEQESSIAATYGSRLNGILYFPSRPLTVTGDGSKAFECSRLLGRKIVFEGRVIIGRSCATDTDKMVLTGAEVRLVG